MIFASILFIFIFLPILAVVYFLLGKKYHNIILLSASILFYAYGEPKYFITLLAVVLVNYIGGLLIYRYKNYDKLFLILTVIANLSFLIYFKYFSFILTNIQLFSGVPIEIPKILMPIGISFYTFQAISYVIDVYRKQFEPQKNILNLALYICFFPQLIAGPIIKYHDFEPQINNHDVNFEKINIGIKRFIIGLSKKMIIANTLGMVADKIFAQSPDSFSHLTAWIGAFAYSLQLYFDFSGYSDMAIGLGLIFGFKFMENFNYPYISKSITEFWRRWHISLSTWFKNYVYIPLGGNKVSKNVTIRNLAFVFLLTGIWHGASWTFIVWGIYNGLFIIIENLFNIKNYESKNIFVTLIQHVYCILVFMLSWVIFRSENLQYAWNYIGNMFGVIKPDNIVYNMGYYFDLYEIIILIIAILCSTPVFKNILEYKNPVLKITVNIFLLFIFIYSVSTIASNTYNPFIYFRF